MVISAGDRVLIKLLIQQKKYGGKILSRNFSGSKRCTLSGLNKLLQKIDTSRFKVTHKIHCSYRLR